MTIIVPPVTRQQTYKEHLALGKVGSRVLAGVNKTSPNVKTKIIRRLTAFQDFRIWVELSPGPTKRIEHMSDYASDHRNTRIRAHFSAIHESRLQPHSRGATARSDASDQTLFAIRW